MVTFIIIFFFSYHLFVFINPVYQGVCGDNYCDGIIGEDCGGCPEDCGACRMLSLLLSFGFLLFSLLFFLTKCVLEKTTTCLADCSGYGKCVDGDCVCDPLLSGPACVSGIITTFNNIIIIILLLLLIISILKKAHNKSNSKSMMLVHG